MKFFKKKLKLKKNDKIVFYQFSDKLFTSDIIFKLCEIVKIENFYIEIFNLSIEQLQVLNLKLNYEDCFIKDCKDRLIIEIKIQNLKNILKIILEFNFDEIVIWDKYTSLENFLLDRKNYLKLKNQTTNNLFYLDYNKYENSFVEFYLDLKLNNSEIENLVNN